MEKEISYKRATKEGRLYIKTSDFFKQSTIQNTIEELLNSDLIKAIDKRNEEKERVRIQTTIPS